MESPPERRCPDLADVEVVSWDVDGTLYSLPRLVAAVKRLARRRLLSLRFLPAVWQLARLKGFLKDMERVRRDQGGVLRPEDHPRDRDVLLRLEQHWYAPGLEEVGLWDGVGDLLDLFEGKGDDATLDPLLRPTST